MMQESVYCKLALNQSVIQSLTEGLHKHKPPAGLVQTLVITEKQYSKMECIVGRVKSDILTTDERFVEL